MSAPKCNVEISLTAVNKMSTQVLQDLSNIKSVDDDDLLKVFSSNLQIIYQYAGKDILEAIESRDLSILNALRCCLFEKIQGSIPEFKHRALVNRKVKHTLLNDIFQMGYSIVNNSVSKELEKAFVATSANSSVISDEDSTATQDLAQLIVTVSSMVIRIGALEKDTAALRKSNADLEKLVAELKGARTTRMDGTAPSSANSTATVMGNNQPEREVAQPDQRVGLSFVDSACSNDGPLTVGSATVTSGSSASSSEDEDGFMELQSKNKRKNRKHDKQKQPKHLPTTMGTALRAAVTPTSSVIQTTLKSATPAQKSQSTAGNMSETRLLYVGNVHPSNSNWDICNHLAKYDVHVSVEDVRPLAKGPKSCSYRVVIPVANFTSLVSDNAIWPAGLKVREFVPAPQHKRRSGPNARPRQRDSRFNSHKRDVSTSHRHQRDNRYDEGEHSVRLTNRRPLHAVDHPRHYSRSYDSYAEVARRHPFGRDGYAPVTRLYSDTYDEYAPEYDSWYSDYTSDYDSRWYSRH